MFDFPTDETKLKSFYIAKIILWNTFLFQYLLLFSSVSVASLFHKFHLDYANQKIALYLYCIKSIVIRKNPFNITFGGRYILTNGITVHSALWQIKKNQGNGQDCNVVFLPLTIRFRQPDINLFDCILLLSNLKELDFRTNFLFVHKTASVCYSWANVPVFCCCFFFLFLYFCWICNFLDRKYIVFTSSCMVNENVMHFTSTEITSCLHVDNFS